MLSELATSLLPALADVSTATGGPEEVAFWSAAGLTALLTITALEIVLGVDNVVFIAILADKLPEEKRARVRTIGLLMAMVMRLILLALAYLIVQLTEPLFTVMDRPISGKSLLLIAGGLFLIAKATIEIHHLIEHVDHGKGGTGDPEGRPGMERKSATVTVVLTQVLLLDMVFSLDSVITAVGMTANYWIMATAVIISIGVMLAFAGPIARFVNKHPTMKNLALSFLVLIGVLLVAEGIGQHFPRGYIYFAMVFAICVEMINMKTTRRRRQSPAPKGAH